MVIIENDVQLEHFKSTYKSNDCYIIPVQSDKNKHPLDGELSLLYIQITDGQEFILPLNHSETVNLDVDINTILVSDTKKYTHDKKLLNHFIKLDNVIDVNMLQYMGTGNPLDLEQLDTQTHDFFNIRYHQKNNINSIIPVLKHLEKCRKLTTILKRAANKHEKELNQSYNDSIIDSLSYIESNGLHTTEGVKYSEYNLYTSTGRPSNRFGGINFAALNKKDGSRKPYVSRFKNGVLVEMDFDAYHLRLIANLVGYKLPNDSVHTYLGKYYFGKDELTEKEYQEAKQINFKILYGGIPEEFKNIEFFSLISKFIGKLWHEWKSKNSVTTYLYKRRMTKERLGEMNPQKLFNYYIQAYETEYNIQVIKRFKKVLNDKQTKVVLCTYDSFLFDFDISDGLDTLKQLKNSMKIQSKVSIGANYGTMIDKSL